MSVLTGAYYETTVDAVVRGPGGMNLALERTYNSRLDYEGSLGYGWIHTFEQHIRRENDNGAIATWVDAMGSERRWRRNSGNWVARDFNHHELVENPDGSFVVTLKTGLKYGFLPEDPNGFAFLSSIEDRDGNAISVQHSGGRVVSVSHDAGQLDFVYDGDYLSKVIDPVGGRTWEYEVDGNGDLVRFMDAVQFEIEQATPGAGKSHRYTYYSDLVDDRLKHNLKCWIRPEANRSPSVDPLCGAEADGHAWMYFSYFPNDRVYRHIDPEANATTFSYNFLRRRTDVTDALGGVTTYFYDQFGNITRFISPKGSAKEFTYNEERREMTSERDAFGMASVASYDDDGNRISQTDKLGNEESWTHDEFGQVTSWTDRRGTRRVWRYDAAGNLLEESIALSDGVHTLRENRYDDRGNLIEAREFHDPSGVESPRTTRFVYDDEGVGIVRIVDAEGRSVDFTLDPLGRPIRSETLRTGFRYGRAFEERVVVDTDYDALDRVTVSTDPIGRIRERVYDANGSLAKIRSRFTLPDGSEFVRVDREIDYDALDRPIAETNAKSEVSSVEYDSLGRIERLHSAGGRTTERQYDPDGNLIREVDPAGAAWEFEYDAADRLVRSVDPEGNESRIDFDIEGRLLAEYGPGDRLIRRVLEYDELGNPLRFEDGDGNETQSVFDEFGRVVQTTRQVGTTGNPISATTAFEYDLSGRLTSKTDAEQRTVHVRYDKLGRAVETTDALGRKSFLRYDEVGNLTEATNAAGDRVSFEHDSRGLLLRRTARGVDDEFRYDPLGRLVSAANDVARKSFGYDALDRVVSVYDPRIGIERRTYEPDGGVAQLVYPSATGFGIEEAASVHYQYDARGQIASVVDPSAGAWTFEYDAAGREVRRVEPSGLERRVGYNSFGFIESVSIATDSFTYGAYDARGNPHTITTSDGTTTIDYDAASRVIHVQYAGAPDEWEEFGYDRVGNRTSYENGSGENVQYAVDDGDQLTAIVDGATQTELETFSYDLAGRRTSHTSGSSTTTYQYDGLGRLARLSAGSSYRMQLSYDPAGSRYRRTETGQPTAFFAGGLVEHRGGEGIRVVSVGGVDSTLAEIAGTEVRSLLSDGSGNVTHASVDAALTYVRRYRAFGSLLGAAGSLPVGRGFGGRPTEGASGLINLRARHYDAEVGRFLQADPLGIGADHLYAYAANNPYVFRDPLGLSPSLGALSQSGGSFFDRFRILGENDTFVPGIGGGISIVPKDQAAEFFDISLKANAALAGTLTLGAAAVVGGALLVPPTAAELLLPGGALIGTAGSQPGIRVLQGGLQQAQGLFNALSRGGQVVERTASRTLVRLQNGGFVQLRTTATRSPKTAATVDVNIPGIPIDKVKFNP